MKRHHRIAFLVVVLGLLLLPGIPAQAHAVADFFTFRWRNANNSTVAQNWRFTTTAPAGGFRARVREGYAQWNNLNQPMRWTEQAPDFADYTLNNGCGPINRNGFRFANIDNQWGVL